MSEDENTYDPERVLAGDPQSPIEKAALKVNNRVEALADGESGDASAVMVENVGPLYVGMPVTSQEAQAFIVAVMCMVASAVNDDEVDLFHAVRGGLENALLVGMMAGASDG